MKKEKFDTDCLPEVRGEYRFAELLNKYTWLNVGGPADVMFFPEDETDLQNFRRNLPSETDVFVLGGGANVLIRDGGIAGVVVKLKNSNFAKVKIAGNVVSCGAGLLNFKLKKTIIEYGLHGLEFLCTIPGSIGGALRTNAGCFGSDISQVMVSAKVMDKKGNIFVADKADFNFAYRHSDFPKDWIILEVNCNYVKDETSAVAKQIAEYEEYRRMHQPQGIKTAGSTFKNPEGYRAWELIKNAGGDKMVVGKAHMSAQHCNFLENEGSNAADIENLGKQIVAAVKQQSGIELQWEVLTVGRRK